MERRQWITVLTQIKEYRELCWSRRHLGLRLEEPRSVLENMPELTWTITILSSASSSTTTRLWSISSEPQQLSIEPSSGPFFNSDCLIKPTHYRCHISGCPAKFYPTGKRLPVVPKDLHPFSKAGDGKFTTVHPLCSSPRLPGADGFIHLLDQQLVMQGRKRKTHRPTLAFFSFVFYFILFFWASHH